ncbi:MAG: glycosyltransferase [Nitrososphaerales archaeon]|nr:glycosyltransferase [Nitrososphaerales archaeon]
MISTDTLLLFFLVVTSLPVFAISYNYVVLAIASLRYNAKIEGIKKRLNKPINPYKVTVIISSFNERYVIERSINAVASIDYPKDRLQIIVADDSTDETYNIVKGRAGELLAKGYDIHIVHREKRGGFKSGALNNALKFAKGEYILIMDSDSIPPKDILMKSLPFMGEDHSFLSFKADHVNRSYNWTTRACALAVDLNDTVEGIGRFCLNVPFCLNGGHSLIRKDHLEQVGGWSPDIIVDDRELSCKLFSSGKNGFFVRDFAIPVEDPPLFEAWKRQTARTAEGAGQCVRKHLLEIWRSKISLVWKMELSSLIIWPLASIGWLVTTYVAALGLIFKFQVAPGLFQNPIYIALVTIPAIITLIVPLYVLRLYGQSIRKNLQGYILMPYYQASMAITNSISFVRGIFGLRHDYFRTPKYGLKGKEGDWKERYKIGMNKMSYLELLTALASGVLGTVAFFNLSYFLGLNLLGFFVITLKSLYMR